MGAIAGAIASGRVPAGGVAGDPWDSWVNPTSVLGGVLAVVVVAYLAAVYLVWDARRLGDERMAEYFRRRAIGAAVVAGVVAFVGIFVLRADARYVFDGLTSRALPFVILSAVCGTARSCCCYATRPAAPASSPSAPSPASWSAGASPNGPTSSRPASRSSEAAAPIRHPRHARRRHRPPRHRRRARLRAAVLLDQKGLLPEESVE